MRTTDMQALIRAKIGEQPPYMKLTHERFAAMWGEFEQALVHEALRRVYGNQVKAAKLLNINRNTLRKLMKKHGIDCKVYIVERPYQYLKQIYKRDPVTGLYI
jgi:DNA-binding NtrC family response regulator